jgi:hypothetical protein
MGAAAWWFHAHAQSDLVAVRCLDEVRTNDLTQSRENLKLADPGLDSGFRHL